MKKSAYSALTLSALLCAAPAYSAIILTYDMSQLQPSFEDAVNTADGGDLMNGGGLTTFTVNANPGGGFATPVLTLTPAAGATTATTAFTNNSFFTFTLTVGSNVEDLDITSLTLEAARGGNSTPRGFAVRVDTPTTTDETVQDSTLIPTVRPNLTAFIVPTTLASLQNLTAGQVVTFEIAAFTPGTNLALEFDNIVVNGDVVLVPEPTTMAMAGLGLAALGFRRRRA